MRTLSTVVLGFLYFILSATNSLAAEISYSDHCSSIVPESRPTVLVRTLEIPLYDLTANYYFWGGDKILGKLKKSALSDDNRNLNLSETHVSFRPVGNVLRTDTPGVYKLEALLVFRLRAGNRRKYRNFSGRSGDDYRRSRRPVSLRFLLQGFWSEQSRRLCMVGASKSSQMFSSVFELTFGDHGNSNSTIFTSLAKGSLRSLNPSSSSSYFDPIKIVSVPFLKDYVYTMNCSERNDLEVPPKQSLSLQKAGFCSNFQYLIYEFEWETASACNASESKDCGPFEGNSSPSLLYLSAFQCSEDEEKLRYILYFKDRGSMYTRALNPNRTYIGEGTWDNTKNHLCIAACRILNSFKDLDDVVLGDCSIRVSLRFPVVWTVRNSSNVVGVGWSSRTTMRLRRSNAMNNGAGFLPGLRYEYTETDKVRELCPKSGDQVRKSGDHLQYPKADSYNMRFQMSAKHGKEKVSYGYAVPIAVGDELYGQSSLVYVMDSGFGEEEESSSKLISQMNVSYKFSFVAMMYQDKFFSVLTSGSYAVEVSAEGVYDSATGNLCMVGCRGYHAANTSVETLDCEILMKFEFPRLDSKVGSSITGFIESRRGKDDPLYFKPLNISSESYYGEHLKKSIWRMDLEIILVLISNTLLCAFVVSQIFYVNKHPEALQSISLVMLVVLALGRMIPLVLNLEALLLKSHDPQQEAVLKSQGSALELNEVSVRLVSLVTFLLLLRLLQMVWSARIENGSEKKTAFVSFVLYGVGGVITLLVEWNFSSESVLKCMKSYGGLVLDGFLLPQIILNVFQNPAQKSLSCWFYMGTTLVRLFPHAYDFYREHYYRNGGASYFYANPSADFYSIAWDVAIPIGCVLLAIVVWVQQRFGARRILPEKIQELSLYEKVPTAEAVISE